MMPAQQTRLAWIWVAMILLTSFSLAASPGGTIQTPLATAFVIAVAFIKARLVLLDFMEIRFAPIFLRATLELWLLALTGTLIFLYL